MNVKYTDEELLMREKEIVRLREEKNLTFSQIAELFWTNEYQYRNVTDGLFSIGATRIGAIYSKVKKFGFSEIGDPKQVKLPEPDNKDQMSELERLLLKVLPNKWNWIVRDKNGDLTLFESKPVKYFDSGYYEPGNRLKNMWINNTKKYIAGATCDFPYRQYFRFIKWSDKEPVKIKDLFGEEDNV